MATINKRQLRLVITAVHESKGIDDLALDGLVTDAVCRFFEETKSGREPVKVRQDIVDGLLHYADKYRTYEIMSERIEKALLLTPDGGDNWNAVIDHCNKMLEKDQTIERWAEWAKENIYDAPHAGQISKDPRCIKTTWLRAFPSGAGDKTEVRLDQYGMPETY
jgi:hypothetical protein